MGWNVTADNWLIYRNLSVVGTLGMGPLSPFWTQTNQSFTSIDNSVTYGFNIG